MIDEGVDYCSGECHNYWRERAERAEAELGKLCPHRTSESNGSYWVCCCCGEYLRKANQ